jgi:hypothetical protein
MNAPLSIAYWEALRRLAEPFELMKFTLIWDGDLPSSGNKPKPIPASNMRNEFHRQLADLWDSHVVFRQLARTARTRQDLTGHSFWESGALISYPPAELPEYNEPIPPLVEGQTDYCAPIPVPNVGEYIPLVRHSLYLACAIDILFLRHQEPFNLLLQGGDLDGRIKTLFDALKMPNPKDNYVGADPVADPLYVVLEDDALISDVSIKTGRLLGNRTKDRHAVRLIIDVTIKVLRVFEQNQCLVGG